MSDLPKHEWITPTLGDSLTTVILGEFDETAVSMIQYCKHCGLVRLTLMTGGGFIHLRFKPVIHHTACTSIQ